MCGIIGYIGKRPAYPVLINGLKKLEYRGYDSAGISVVDEKVKTYKCKGKIGNLEKHIKGKDLNGVIGIGHTRWATHGEPNDTNAHPHRSQHGHFIIIHNGIIENYARLKNKLIEKGINLIPKQILKFLQTLLNIFILKERFLPNRLYVML